jgi:hypothetical protein
MNRSLATLSWLGVGILVAAVISFGVVMMGCYTMLTHPIVAEPLPARADSLQHSDTETPAGEMQSSTGQVSCTACHNAQYDHAYHRHYWDDWGWYPSYYYGYVGWNRYYWRPWWYDYNYPPYWWYDPGGGGGGSPGEPPSKREFGRREFGSPAGEMPVYNPPPTQQPASQTPQPQQPPSQEQPQKRPFSRDQQQRDQQDEDQNKRTR